jgi:hypothetical protein
VGLLSGVSWYSDKLCVSDANEGCQDRKKQYLSLATPERAKQRPEVNLIVKLISLIYHATAFRVRLRRLNATLCAAFISPAENFNCWSHLSP